MRYLFLILIFSVTLVKGGDNHFLFSYFVDNGQDGLHLAYSNDGLVWKELNGGKSYLKPTAGGDKLMRDPFILQGPDGIFHMVWTCSWKERQIGYAFSKDLINWSEQKTIPVMAHEPTAKNCWAPEMVYDKKNKNYLIFWATTIPGRHADVASSEREKGLNHRMYCTTTTDFNQFSPTILFFNPNFSVIDATILQKGKTSYMFLKNENPNPPEKNIRISTAKKVSGPYALEVSAPVTGKYWAEGPSTLVVGNYVYVYFDKYTEHKYGAVRSKNMKEWEDVSSKVLFPKGVRHGSAFKVSEEVLNNHLILGHLMEWFYTGLGGIKQEPGSTAFKNIVIRPEIVGDLTQAKASYLSPYGRIVSEWIKGKNSLVMNIEIPSNKDATIYFPELSYMEVSLNGKK